MGGDTPESVSGANLLSIPFTFGCQESEQGLFRTQHVDGIMGLSAKIDTFPFQLKRGNKTQTKRFSLCFRPKGGYLILASSPAKAIDTHSRSLIKPPTTYIPLIKGAGWFTVKLVDILMYVPAADSSKMNSNLRGSNGAINSINGNKESIGATTAKYNGGKGTIIDSGTTDTFLPASIRQNFESMFNKLVKGVSYSNSKMTLTDEQFRLLPVIVYRFVDKYDESKFIDIETHPYSYSEKVRSSKSAGRFEYVFRIYLTEANGAVLGSNFMNYHNIEFDVEKLRVSIQPDSCHFKPPAPPSGRFLESTQAIDYDENIKEFESMNFWDNDNQQQEQNYNDQESIIPAEKVNVFARRRLIFTDEYNNSTLEDMYQNSKHIYEYTSSIATTNIISESVTRNLLVVDNYSNISGAYNRELTLNDGASSMLKYETDIGTFFGFDYSSCIFVILLVVVFLMS